MITSPSSLFVLHFTVCALPALPCSKWPMPFAHSPWRLHVPGCARTRLRVAKLRHGAVACMALLLGAMAAPSDAPAAGVLPVRLRVGLLAQGVFWKGLFRDVEIVTWGKRASAGCAREAPRTGGGAD